VHAVGDPDLPVAVPGADDSPGINNCNCVKEVALTVMAELVFVVIAV
jgi:hypothetical protein